MTHQRKLGPLLFAGFVLVVVGLTVAACGGSSGDQGTPKTPGSASGTVTTGSARSTKTANTGATTPDAAGTGSPNVGISPGEVTMGNVVVTFTVQPARPILDPVRTPATPTGGGDQKADGPSGTYVVLGGSALKVTNNLDPSQSAPADQAQEMLRHVSAQVTDKTEGQLIPSLVMTMDLLREGRPVLQDQPLVPMVPSGGAVSQMAYGNNVKFPGVGEYQVFVRIEPSPLLGAGGAGVAQFNVSIKGGQ
ncbi:MAG: iron transporter [Chloroflexi bacterium]|nr:iron transporter [Chloroflexota bacterium]